MLVCALLRTRVGSDMTTPPQHWLYLTDLGTATPETLISHLLGQEIEIEVQYHFSGHMMPLVLASASYNADGIVNETTAFIRSR